LSLVEEINDLLVLPGWTNYLAYTWSLLNPSSAGNLRVLILELVSRLYAFSAYLFPT